MLVSFVVALICAAVLGEILLRYFESRRATVPETMPYLYYRHERLRYALVRNGDYYGWAHINGQGFRGKREVALEKQNGVLRIMAVGGSTTFDTTVSGDDKAWAARLEHYLQELAPERRVEVINAGVPGYRNIDNLIRLETELHRYRPDVIILYEVHNRKRCRNSEGLGNKLSLLNAGNRFARLPALQRCRAPRRRQRRISHLHSDSRFRNARNRTVRAL